MKRNKLLLLVASAGCLAVLAAAAWQENVLRDWRRIQRDYQARLAPEAASEFRVQLRQIVVPRLGATDRCVSCHVGMAPGETGLAGERIFRKHPDVVHDPGDIGCVVCHAGQGRATDADDAHGRAPFWPTPLIPVAAAHAGCGACHTSLAVPNIARLARGQELVERADCLACHQLEGRGGTLRPGGAAGIDGGDLSRVGGRGYDADWYAKHLRKHEDAAGETRASEPWPLGAKDVLRFAEGEASVRRAPGPESAVRAVSWGAAPALGGAPTARASRARATTRAASPAAAPAVAASSTAAAHAAAAAAWATSFGPIPEDDRGAIETFLGSRVGAPGLIEAKALFHSLGCRGCHKVNGVGGADGPDLTRIGDKDPGRIDFGRVPGEPTLSNYFAEHFRDPAAVVPGSAMPVLGLDEEQIRRLTGYMLSLRAIEVEGALHPKDRIRVERFGEREFATDGQTLFGTFCAACHGPRGEGMRYPGAPAFPAIGSAEFLRLASDAFIVETIRRGRPGRRMPAWGESEGGLRPAEIAAVAAWVRSMGGVAAEPDPRPPRWTRGDARLGRTLYAENCATCHGAAGEGKEGTALNNPVLLESATDTYLYQTILRGRAGTSMPAFFEPSTTHRALSEADLEAIVAFMRGWEKTR